ncbi:hypothetical protein [Thermofilum sp.]|jgi:hypothetical protein|nr:hypothetical protein [Thermofilum sp.]
MKKARVVFVEDKELEEQIEKEVDEINDFLDLVVYKKNKPK